MSRPPVVEIGDLPVGRGEVGAPRFEPPSHTAEPGQPMEQVEQLYITLKVLGRPVDLVVFRESHHLVYGGKPWSRAGHAQAVREWLERYL